MAAKDVKFTEDDSSVTTSIKHDLGVSQRIGHLVDDSNTRLDIDQTQNNSLAEKERKGSIRQG